MREWNVFAACSYAVSNVINTNPFATRFARGSRSCISSGTVASYGIRKTPYAVKNTRGIGKKDMKLNDCLPEIKVDPETYRVTADGQVLTCKVADSLPLGRMHFLF